MTKLLCWLGFHKWRSRQWPDEEVCTRKGCDALRVSIMVVEEVDA